MLCGHIFSPPLLTHNQNACRVKKATVFVHMHQHTYTHTCIMTKWIYTLSIYHFGKKMDQYNINSELSILKHSYFKKFKANLVCINYIQVYYQWLHSLFFQLNISNYQHHPKHSFCNINTYNIVSALTVPFSQEKIGSKEWCLACWEIHCKIVFHRETYKLEWQKDSQANKSYM